MMASIQERIRFYNRDNYFVCDGKSYRAPKKMFYLDVFEEARTEMTELRKKHRKALNKDKVGGDARNTEVLIRSIVHHFSLLCCDHIVRYGWVYLPFICCLRLVKYFDFKKYPDGEGFEPEVPGEKVTLSMGVYNKSKQYISRSFTCYMSSTLRYYTKWMLKNKGIKGVYRKELYDYNKNVKDKEDILFYRI